MFTRALLLLLTYLAVAAASAAQSDASDERRQQDSAQSEPAAVRRPMQDIKNIETAEQVNDERFAVREEFGQTQQQQRTRWMAPESIKDKSRMKDAEVDQAEDDVDSVTAEQTRAKDEDGRTDKNDRARTLEPCATNAVEAHIAANASGTASGNAAATASGATQQGCAN